MRRSFIFPVACAVLAAVLSLPAFASPPSPADFPLRAHIYEQKWHKHPNGTVDGEGRANLFEHGQPRAFDYSFACSELFRASMGWETYPARWRKKDGELEILTPVMGKPGARAACTLKVVMKSVAYYKRDGKLNEEPASVLKEWMQKHNYDPEHGKNQPTGMSAPSESRKKTE
jgi:hypothetical protein